MVRNELHASSHESTGSATVRRPVRTCVGCKERVSAADLLRVVVRRSEGGAESSESVIVPDTDRRLPGRGAWLHLDVKCLDNAERRRAFGRALRAHGTVDTSAVATFVEGVASEERSQEHEDQGDRAVPVEKNRQQH
ncbi:YlxR family protein [Rhodococcus sp. G-MC3]|uniref:YlxR family protein n=1 Tax=Rhodococcus sp. G-MC3 TaxID=3046209 RepID=UPI0024BA9FC6|nr:YlxR family protein [Rhodococcus sp. G-MC3]MDJ0391863.1 YlxR family protein [Rhodococcus sp. G-MC3]